MTNAPPKVSVIIPSYNYGQYLEECVRSVFAQTYQNYEIIISDDGSTDNTPQVAELLMSNAPVPLKYIRGVNRGVSESRNEAISQSTGEFIMPLDADDKLLPTALHDFSAALQADPKAGYAYSNLENYQALPGEPRIWQQGPFFKKLFLIENNAASASMWRRSLFESGVKYRQVIFEDWDLWQQIAARGYVGAYVPKVLFQYRMHLSGRTGKNRYFHFPALLQEMRGNKSLYDASLVAWAERCLTHDPKCWNKPTVVLLPHPESADFSALSGIWQNLADHFIAQGHFVVAIGRYAFGGEFKPGLAQVSLPEYHLGPLCHRLGSLGSELLVISELPEWFNARIEALKNVGVLASLHSETHFSDASQRTTDLLVRTNPYYLSPSPQGFILSRGALDLISSPPERSLHELAETLSEQATSHAREKKRLEDRHWAALHSIVSTGSRPVSLESNQLRFTQIIPLSRHEISVFQRMTQLASAAQQPLRAVLYGSDGAVLREALPTSRPITCGGFLSRAPYSYARVANYEARMAADTDWLLFTRSDTLPNENLGRVASELTKTFGERAIYPLEANYLLPGNDAAGRAALRQHTSCDGILISAKWLGTLGGFSEDFIGEGGQFDDLLWRSETCGGRVIWFPPGLLTRVFSLERRSQSDHDHQSKTLEGHKSSFPHSLVQGEWGQIRDSERAEYCQSGEMIWPLAQALMPLLSLENELVRPTISSADCIQGLLVWGQHCLQNRERPSAEKAFYDVLLYDGEHADAHAGLAACKMESGNLPLSGHHALVARMAQPNHSLAQQVLEMLDKIQTN